MPSSLPAERPGPVRSPTDDGLAVALYDLGGSGPDLLLAHATGFCAEVFVPLAGSLSATFHCWAVDLRGHGRSDRPRDGHFAWSGFGADLLAAVDHAGLHRPFGFGHSCGGAAVLLAEQARTGLFAALYCFEPVMFPADGSRRGPVTDNPLSAGARRRRETFSSPDEAFVTFSSRPPLSVLDPEVLRWYVAAGFEVVPDDEGGDGSSIRLRCRRQDEATVYAEAFTSTAFVDLPNVHCPVTLACGELTDSFGVPALEADAHRLARSRIEVISGVGHFGPLERPELVADAVSRAFVHEIDTPGS